MQIEPGPIPTLIISTPNLIKNLAASNVAIFPAHNVVLFVFFPFRFVFFFWLVFGFFYPLGINEFLVKFVSEFFGLGLYESIRFYSITV